ncbi:hypothetical protein F5X99DRAFT_7313 [Biscogniauxia marginata]|nr:hypothetical protein F5X99DRAFT_7313 [Biscogniauxia marginata]
MFGKKGGSGFQGHAYIILQVIRCCNVAVFLATMIACVLMMIFAKMPNGYQFFGDVSLAFVLVVAGVLAYTEIGAGPGQKLITSTWPVLGIKRGFTWLGISMFLIGCHLLGALSDDTYTDDSVPAQVGQVIMGAGIIALAFGIINVLTSFAFKNRDSGVSAREVRNNGAITQDVTYRDDYSSHRSNSVRKEKKGKKEKKEKKERRRTSIFDFAKDRKPKISRPIPRDIEQGYDECRYDECPDDRSSPIIPDVQRPPSALHPAFNTGRKFSHYSEASHIDRFAENRI